MRIKRVQTQHEIQRETVEFCSPAFSLSGTFAPYTFTALATGDDNMSATPMATASLSDPWMDGNYDLFSRFMEMSAYQFLDRLDIDPESTLLAFAPGHSRT